MVNNNYFGFYADNDLNDKRIDNLIKKYCFYFPQRSLYLLCEKCTYIYFWGRGYQNNRNYQTKYDVRQSILQPIEIQKLISMSAIYTGPPYISKKIFILVFFLFLYTYVWFQAHILMFVFVWLHSEKCWKLVTGMNSITYQHNLCTSGLFSFSK